MSVFIINPTVGKSKVSPGGGIGLKIPQVIRNYTQWGFIKSIECCRDDDFGRLTQKSALPSSPEEKILWDYLIGFRIIAESKICSKHKCKIHIHFG